LPPKSEPPWGFVDDLASPPKRLPPTAVAGFAWLPNNPPLLSWPPNPVGFGYALDGAAKPPVAGAPTWPKSPP